MSELFIELLSEEIPARMQKQAMENLNRLLNNAVSYTHLRAHET